MKKIVLTGPESSGKTYLSKSLSAFFNCPNVEEYAREYLHKINRPYNFNDITKIAKGQISAEDKYLNTSVDLIICDTDSLVCKIWQEYKYGYCDDWINETFENRHYDLFLLCCPDLAWEADPLREHQFERDLIFELYHKALTFTKKPFALINGPLEQRFNLALEHIYKIFKQ